MPAGTRTDENLSGIHPRTKAEDFSELNSESSDGAVTGFRLTPEWYKGYFRGNSGQEKLRYKNGLPKEVK